MENSRFKSVTDLNHLAHLQWSEHPPGRAGGDGTTAEEQKGLCHVLPAERTGQLRFC